jgi:hypothetical protein
MSKTKDRIPISTALAKLVSTTKFGVENDYDLSTINWDDADVTQPSNSVIEAKRQEMADEFNANEYKTLRAEGEWELQNDSDGEHINTKIKDGYPSLPDQLDMLYWDKENDTTTHKDAIDEIKTRFPKPS